MAEIKRQTRGEGELLTVAGDLTVAHIREVHAAVSDALARAAVVDVEVRDVSALDVSFLQLLCSAHRTADERGKNLRVRGLDRGQAGEVLLRSGFLRHIGCRDSTRRTCLWVQDGAAGG
jgi:ABC-type transporter Mla MlaB component